jgi:hypothetical protein
MILFRPIFGETETIVQVLVNDIPVGKIEENTSGWTFLVQTRCRFEPWHLAAIGWQIGQLQMDLIEENVFESYKDFHEAMLGI